MLTGTMTNRRSNAKTAYGLMSDIKAYILEEPKRVWMGDWVIEDMDEIKTDFGVEGPACGTVGCIAGNVKILTGNLGKMISTQRLAMDVLGGGSNDLEDDLYDLFHETHVDAKYGTKKYARIVAKRIEEFQAEHEQELRAVGINQNDRR